MESLQPLEAKTASAAEPDPALVDAIARKLEDKNDAGPSQSPMIEGRSSPDSQNAIPILEQRYARGEVDREEFIRRHVDPKGG
ncbi:MAG: hypothetical protein DI596_08385 [Azospira oryzae]|nr:MAG: hypothetical protein DI596_08385 [Azospira oryzae]PZP79484.1 MAG: hypothetical protein DI593_08385 [Azospira oryzae]